MEAVSATVVPFLGWSRCLRLANGHIELVITLEVGPRIIHCSLAGGPNFMCVLPGAGQSGGDEFKFYGGHRLWLAPEHPVRTYQPDNRPVTWEPVPNGVRLSAGVDAFTGLQKELTLTLAPDRPSVEVVHRLINHLPWGITAAPWAISMLAAGGVGILPLPPRAGHEGNLLPTASLAVWPYTDLSDPRWGFGRQFVRLEQHPDRSSPQKIGLHGPVNWAAYWRQGQLLAKTVAVDPQAVYPDLNSHLELFTNGEMLEVESLGPLREIPSEGATAHVERWQLVDQLPRPDSDDIIREVIVPAIHIS